MGANRGECAVEHANGGGDERLVRKKAGIRYQVARGKIIGAVGNDVVVVDQRDRVGRDQSCRVGLDLHVRIEAADRGRRALHLSLADLGRAVDHLALQVG